MYCIFFFLSRRFRKATRNIVDAWLVSHASTSSCGLVGGGGGGNNSGANVAVSPTGNERENAAGMSGGGGGGGSGGGGGGGTGAGTANSGTTTPVRKISAHEFERGGLKPMVTTVDGTPTFLASSLPDETTTAPVSRRRSRHELRQLDEKQLIFELVSTRRRLLIRLIENLAPVQAPATIAKTIPYGLSMCTMFYLVGRLKTLSLPLVMYHDNKTYYKNVIAFAVLQRLKVVGIVKLKH